MYQMKYYACRLLRAATLFFSFYLLLNLLVACGGSDSTVAPITDDSTFLDGREHPHRN